MPIVSANNEGQTLWDSCFHIINPVLLKGNEVAQGTHLIGTKLQIQVSGKYFRTVSVTSSGVLNWLEVLSDGMPECGEMKKKSTIDNSKQARPISASCFNLRKCQSEAEACGCSELWYQQQWSFRVRTYWQEELTFPNFLLVSSRPQSLEASILQLKKEKKDLEQKPI